MTEGYRENPSLDERNLKAAVAALTDVQLLRIRALITALRSGDLRQGQNRLTSITEKGEEYHCCLGVACLVAMEADSSPIIREKSCLTWDSVTPWWNRDSDIITLTGQIEYDYEASVLPSHVREWYGFDDVNPDVFWAEKGVNGKDIQTVRSLASLNDSGVSFSRIADAIENTYIVPRLPKDPGEPDAT